MTSPSSSPSAAPAAALVVRPDTLGDLVLFAPTLRALRQGWPATRLAVVIRRAYLELARMLAPGVEWIATDLDPYVQGPGEAEDELTHLGRVVRELAPAVVIAACPRRHWLDTALAAAVPQARRVAFVSDAEDPYFGVQVRSQLGLGPGPFFREIAPAAPGEQDWEQAFGLASHLLGRTIPRSAPTLELEPAALHRADAILRRLGLAAGEFVACAAAGFANVKIKTWPAERYGSTLAWLKREHGVRALLVGQENERAYLETVAAAAGEAAPAIWTGGVGDLPLLAALLSRAALYFGNDTGAMHLAAAVGRPVAAIFGGGTWPRFLPAARRSISLVHPLPCFGCGWECPFGDAPCVRAVGEDDARQALSDLWLRRDSAAAEIRPLRTLPEDVVAFMGKTAAVARERNAAHLAREHKLEAIAFLAGEKDGEIARLKEAANEKDAEIAALKAATNEKDAEIEEKDGEIVGLKDAANGKDDEIGALKRATDGKDAEIAALARACEERLQLIVRLDADLKTYVAEVGRLEAAAKK